MTDAQIIAQILLKQYQRPVSHLTEDAKRLRAIVEGK